MSGLIRSHFYTIYASVKWLAVSMLAFGIVVVAIDNDNKSLLIIYALLCITGFSANAIAGLRKESGSNWKKYQLTVPVTRRQIIHNHYVSQLLWIGMGCLLAGVVIVLSALLHGFPFDTNTDVLMIFSVGISIDLFMGAIFYPLFYLGGEERSEVILEISLIASASIIAGIIFLLNFIFGYKMELIIIIISAAIMMIIAIFAYILSQFITVRIFNKKEY